MYKNSKASFDTVLEKMHIEVYHFTFNTSKQHCKVYKHWTFDSIAEDHAYMDVAPFVLIIMQNICMPEALLASDQVGWSTVTLQIMMAAMLTEVALVPSHLEFVHYLTK